MNGVPATVKGSERPRKQLDAWVEGLMQRNQELHLKRCRELAGEVTPAEAAFALRQAALAHCYAPDQIVVRVATDRFRELAGERRETPGKW